MQNKKIFFLSFKGVESGPYAPREIKTMLDTGKIGLLHSIRTKSTDWKLLKDANLAKYQYDANDESGKSKSKKDNLTILTYLFAGLTFVSTFMLIASIALSIYLWVANEKKIAIVSLIMALFLSMCGYVFFEEIYPMLY